MHRGWRSNLALAAAATVLSLAAVEGYFRATYRSDWYRQHNFAPGQEPVLNQRGFRDVNYGPKTSGAYRILLLGDSFTFGSGVADDQAIWPALVERQLNDLRPLPGITTYEVLNAGVAGSLTNQWLDIYQRERTAFAPDLIVATFFIRDGTPLLSESMLTALRAELAHGGPLARVSVAYRYFVEKQTVARVGGLLRDFLVTSYVGTPAQTAEWRRAQQNLLAIAQTARADGTPFLVVVFPMLYGIDQDPNPFAPIMDTLEAFCRLHRLPHRSLLPAFRGERPAAVWISEANQHPNARGHQIAAEAMLPFLREHMTAGRR